MKKIKVMILFLVFLGSSVNANSLQGLKSQYVDQCVQEGEHKAVCACSFDQFTQQAPANQKQSVKAFLESYISGKQPTAAQMQKFQPLMMTFQQVGFQCASQTHVQEDASNTMDLSQMMGGQMPPEMAQMLNQFANQDDASTMQSLMALDQQNKQQRQEKRKLQKIQRDKEAEERNKLHMAMKKEDQRLNQSPLTLNVMDYKKAFELKAQILEQSQSQTNCAWKLLKSLAGQGPSSSLTANFAIFGGDYDKPKSFKPYLAQAMKNYHAYNEKVSACF